LELDDEVLAQAIAPPPPSRSFALTSHSTSPTIHNPIDFDPKQPFFFPGDLPTKAQTRKDGWNWRDPVVGFWRTETEDDIRKKWTEERAELTRTWKRRWREAVKMRKRRGGDLD